MKVQEVISPRMSQRVEETVRAFLLKHRPEMVFTVGIDIVFHRNRSTIVSWSRRGSLGTLRLHRIFLRAPGEILEALVQYFFTKVTTRESRRLRSRIMDYVEQNRRGTLGDGGFPRIRPPKGKAYDLDQDRNKVIRLYVRERIAQPRKPRMGWSWKSTPSLMGKWIERPPGNPNLIVINRLLDSKDVPDYYLDYIVYHEILHDLFPIRRQDGRWVHHSTEFRKREKNFPRYDEARSWELEHLPGLISR